MDVLGPFPECAARQIFPGAPEKDSVGTGWMGEPRLYLRAPLLLPALQLLLSVISIAGHFGRLGDPDPKERLDAVGWRALKSKLFIAKKGSDSPKVQCSNRYGCHPAATAY